MGRNKIAAILMGTAHIYHIIASDIKAFNEALERIRSDISEIGKIEDLRERIGEYRKRIDKLDPIMYPPTNTYRVIKIPIIPYPIDYIGKIMRILTSKKPVEMETIKMDNTALYILEKFNILRTYMKTGRKYITLGKEGERLKQILT